MFQLSAMYGHPQDTQAFDRHYEQVHAQLALKMPGLKGYTSFRPTSLTQQKSPYYLVADLYFESQEALQKALQSPEGQAAAGDLQNFATGGVALVAGEVQVYDSVSIS